MIEYNVYSHIDKDDNILYIGKSKNLKSRQNQHRNSSHWFESIEKIKYLVFKTKIEMDIAELYLINKYSPIYNKKDNRSDNVSIVSIEENWINFDIQFAERKVKSRGNPMKKSGEIYQDDYGNYITSYNIPNAIMDIDDKIGLGNYNDFLINIFSNINYMVYEFIKNCKHLYLENGWQFELFNRRQRFELEDNTYTFYIDAYNLNNIQPRKLKVMKDSLIKKQNYIENLNYMLKPYNLAHFNLDKKEKLFIVSISKKTYENIIKNIDCFEEIKYHHGYDYLVQFL